ncbi:hypothetical protein PG990_010408 [Apiospora arundinis]
MALTVLVSLAIVVCYVAHLSYRWHRLCHIPGPFWAPFLTRWHNARSQYAYIRPLDLKTLSDQYGKISHIRKRREKKPPTSKTLTTTYQGKLIRVGPNQIVTSDIETILRINSPCSGYSGGIESCLPNQSPCLLSCSDQEKKCTRPEAHPCWYEGESHLEEMVQRQCSRLIASIEQECLSTDVIYKPLEMNSASLWLISNVIRDIVASWSSDPLEDARQSRCAVSRKKRRAISRLVAALLPNRDKADTLTTILTHILSTSVAYSKLKSEIYERAADLGTQHRPAAAVIRGCLPSSLWELPYLQAVIKEGCRMSHAAAAATALPHVSLKSPKTGDIILGFKIPGGTEIGPDVSGIMRATKYWGNDAEAFRPERWLEARGEESYPTMESALDILWGLKSSTRPQGHDHLGKIAAETFLSMVVAMMLARFDISLVEPPRNASRTGQPGETQPCYVRFTLACWDTMTGLDVT